MAVRIDTSSVILSLSEGDGQACPGVGERVKLELQLPVNSESGKAKCLAVRAHVTHVEELPDGSRQLGLGFRKAIFKDRADQVAPKLAKSTTNGWEM